MGLALGTKYTAFFALPGLLLLAVAALPPRRLAALVASAVVGFLAVGSYGYVENLMHSGTVLGSGAQEVGSATAAVTARRTISTMARNLYRFGDLPGYRVKTRWLDPLASLGRNAFHLLHISTAPPEASTGGSPFRFDINVGSSPGGTWYGPLGSLLVVPLSLGFALLWALRRASRVRGLLAISLPLYLLVTALAYRYTSQGRFFITPVAFVLPLAAVLYRRRWLAACVAAIGAVTLFFALSYDLEKPTGLGGTKSIWSLSRPEAQSISFGADTGRLIRAVDRLSPREDLGVAAGQLYFGFALYGPTLERQLIPLSMHNPLMDASRRGIRAVYLSPGVVTSSPTREWKLRRFGDAGSLAFRAR